MSNLAVYYDAAGRTVESIKRKEQSLELRTAKLGLEHHDAITSMANFAASYRRAGMTEAAIRLNEHALQLRKTDLGATHPDTLLSMNSLAASYGDAGRTDEAIKLHELTLKVRTSKLGPDHPHTLYSMGDLAASYDAVGRNDDAVKLDEKSSQIKKDKFGPERPQTFDAMSFLAESYEAAGRSQPAFETRQKKHNLLLEKLGANHSDTFEATLELVQMLAVFPEVVSELNNIIEDLKKRSENTPNSLVLRMLALAEYRSGNFKAAISAAESSIEKSPGSSHPMNLAMLGMSHFKLGEVEKAKEFRNQLGESMKRDEFKDDKNCLLLTHELNELAAFQPAAISCWPED